MSEGHKALIFFVLSVILWFVLQEWSWHQYIGPYPFKRWNVVPGKTITLKQEYLDAVTQRNHEGYRRKLLPILPIFGYDWDLYNRVWDTLDEQERKNRNKG